jgi:hypothetical protein
MGVYLGLEKDWPDASRAARDRLERAAQESPDDPLPALLLALVACHYREYPEAARWLGLFYPRRLPDLEKSMARYLAVKVDLRQGVFMYDSRRAARTDPPLRGYLQSGLFATPAGPEGRARPLQPLQNYNVFLDLDAGGRDLTPTINKRLEDMRAHWSRHLRPLVLADAKQGTTLTPGPGMKLTSMRPTATYEVAGREAFLETGPVRLDPLKYIGIQMWCWRNGAGPAEISVAWLYAPESGAPRWASAPARARGLNPADQGLMLVEWPRWLQAPPLTAFRVYPNLDRGEFQIINFQLFAASVGPDTD